MIVCIVLARACPWEKLMNRSIWANQTHVSISIQDGSADIVERAMLVARLSQALCFLDRSTLQKYVSPPDRRSLFLTSSQRLPACEEFSLHPEPQALLA
jgi:hypothetical protein